MCSGVRRGGEANNAIRVLASVSQTYCVCLYLSQLFTRRRQQRKKGGEQNREGQKQSEKSGGDTELKVHFKRCETTNVNGKETEEKSFKEI